MDDPEKLNDRTTYQRCFACGGRNDQGLRLVSGREGDRIRADFTPNLGHRGFPGVLHGGIIATLLDETMGRTGALRREWLITGKLDIRYRLPAPIDQPVRVWGQIAQERSGAVDAVGAVELTDGTVVAEGRGVFLKGPEPGAPPRLSQFPDFAD